MCNEKLNNHLVIHSPKFSLSTLLHPLLYIDGIDCDGKLINIGNMFKESKTFPKICQINYRRLL